MKKRKLCVLSTDNRGMRTNSPSALPHKLDWPASYHNVYLQIASPREVIFTLVTFHCCYICALCEQKTHSLPSRKTDREASSPQILFTVHDNMSPQAAFQRGGVFTVVTFVGRKPPRKQDWASASSPTVSVPKGPLSLAQLEGSILTGTTWGKAFSLAQLGGKPFHGRSIRHIFIN